MTTTTCVRSLRLLLSRSSSNLGQTLPTKLLTKIPQPINCISTAALTRLRLSRSVCSAHISHQQVSLSVLQNRELKRPHQRRQYRVPSGIQWSNCIHRRNMSDSIVPNPPNLVFRQLFDYQSYTYTYLLADKDTKDAILIDPVVELVKRDMHLLEDLGLNLIYAINTHCHADHITGTGVLKEKLPGCKSIISKYSGAKSDLTVVDGDQIKFGNLALDVVATPGHTDGCVTYILRNAQGTPVMAFTGDAILIRGCGRTDFQQGDAGRLYDSVHGKILSLPAETRLHPAHDYTGQTVTTVGEERKFNPRLTKTKEEFIKIMEQLNLPYPKAIDKALPANLVCGIVGEEYQ